MRQRRVGGCFDGLGGIGRAGPGRAGQGRVWQGRAGQKLQFAGD